MGKSQNANEGCKVIRVLLNGDLHLPWKMMCSVCLPKFISSICSDILKAFSVEIEISVLRIYCYRYEELNELSSVSI